MATKQHLREEAYYEPFANWLKGENGLNECTEAVALGGKCLNQKWGTPDVIGIYRPSPEDVIQFLPELISAEIKTNSQKPITAFGQAIAYRLFSTTVYLVEPRRMSREDRDRIEALCLLFGIGLIQFNLDPQKPKFEIRVRAQSLNPDTFYVNEFIRTLSRNKKDVFDKLFS